MHCANPYRGEASLVIQGKNVIFRPSFERLVTIEDELGSLFALLERVAGGDLKLTEVTALLWHCIVDYKPWPNRNEFDAQCLAIGLVNLTPVVKMIMKQVLQGQALGHELDKE